MNCTDDTRYEKLLYHLKDGLQLGQDKYPITIFSIYDLLVMNSRHIDHKRRHKRGQRVGTARPDIMFAQKGITNENDG